jgi:glutamate racemase
MSRDTVAFLDSGVGGLPYLEHARKLLPAWRCVYAADAANFPYGEKDRGSIIEAAIGVAERLIRREDPRLVVVACNTMSVVALEDLRARFPIPFVGVVPAVKPAALISRRKRVGVLATRRTVEGEYLHDLIRRFAADCAVVSLPSADLVEFVERDLYASAAREREERVRREVERFRRENIDALVLGCTHFLHLEPEFKRLLDAEGIALVDSREGVARQVRRLLPDPHGGLNGREADRLYVTGANGSSARYAWFAERFRLALEGGL